MSQSKQNKQLDDNTVFSGFILGLLVGGLVAVFRGPRIHLDKLREMAAQATTTGREMTANTGKEIRSKLEAALPTDSINDSITEGKEAARRRRVELGLDQ